MPTDPSIKCPQLYKALKRDGYSKSDAARISNGLWRKGKCTGERKETIVNAMPTATKEHTGIMVAFFLPLVVAQGITALYRDQFDFDATITPANDLHLTLMYLGDTNTTAYDAGQLSEWLWEWAQTQQPIRGVLNGIGKFNSVSPEGVPVYLSYDSPELPAFRQSLVDFFQSKGLNLEFNHGFTPHITLAYTPNYKDGWLIDVPPQEIVFDEITLAFGGNQFVVPLGRSNFTVTKDAKTGEYRWTLISSSAYVDRDGEIVTEEALEKAVAKMKATGQYGNLLWWHTPIVLGKADFAMVYAYQLLESGTFASKDVAEKVAAAAGSLGASIGFNHSPTQPRNKAYDDVTIVERSLLPRGKESNLYTRLSVAGGTMKELTADKRAGLIALLGEDEATAHISLMENTAKAADLAGVTRKEKGLGARLWDWFVGQPEFEAVKEADEESDLDDDSAEIEAEAGTEADKAKKADDMDEDDKPVTVGQVKAMLAAWEKNRTKETDVLATKAEVAAIVEAVTPVVEVQQDTVKRLGQVEKQIGALVSTDVPRSVAGMFRASGASETVTEKAADAAQTFKEVVDPFEAHLNEKLGV